MAFSTRPLVIHAGFHKTGTSSLQQTLKANRTALKRHCNLLLKPRLKDILHATRGYSTWRDPLTRAKMVHRADTFLAEQLAYRHRGLILSAEELAGHMPGRDAICDYSAALILLPELVAAFHRRYRAPDLHVVFTTRSAQSWLTSAYWEHVKSSSMTLSQDEFTTRFAPAARFDALLDDLAAKIAPIPLHRIPLEDWANTPLGLAEPVLRLQGVPDDTLQTLAPIPPVNTRLPGALLQELLDLNRNIGDREARKQAKQALIARYETDAPSE